MTAQAIRDLINTGLDEQSARAIIAKAIVLKRMEKEQAEGELARLEAMARELDRNNLRAVA